jgi:hypothetical protein
MLFISANKATNTRAILLIQRTAYVSGTSPSRAETGGARVRAARLVQRTTEG